MAVAVQCLNWAWLFFCKVPDVTLKASLSLVIFTPLKSLLKKKLTQIMLIYKPNVGVMVKGHDQLI